MRLLDIPRPEYNFTISFLLFPSFSKDNLKWEGIFENAQQVLKQSKNGIIQLVYKFRMKIDFT